MFDGDGTIPANLRRAPDDPLDDAMTISEATKGKTTPENADVANARSLVKRLLEGALEKHEADGKVLRRLISQIPEASPPLLQKFAWEAGWPESRFAEEFMASAFGYLDVNVVPFYGKGLDAFLSHHLEREELRRRRRDASSHESEVH
jgi:hypothetical protein